MPGNQSRGLVQASKTKGWDPTKIPAGQNGPAVDLSKIDVDMGNLPGPYLGRLSDAGPPADAPDGYDQSIGAQHDTWNTHYQSEPKVRRGTDNANPFPVGSGS